MEKKKFTQEFKQDTIDYYHTIRDVSEEIGIGSSTLSRWLSDARKNDGKIEHRGSGNYSSEKDKEIVRLKKELKDTQDALTILKKAMGILGN